MVGWHHRLDGHESEYALGVGDGREAWCAAVQGVAKSQIRLSDRTEQTKEHQKKWGVGWGGEGGRMGREEVREGGNSYP